MNNQEFPRRRRIFFDTTSVIMFTVSLILHTYFFMQCAYNAVAETSTKTTMRSPLSSQETTCGEDKPGYTTEATTPLPEDGRALEDEGATTSILSLHQAFRLQRQESTTPCVGRQNPLVFTSGTSTADWVLLFESSPNHTPQLERMANRRPTRAIARLSTQPHTSEAPLVPGARAGSPHQYQQLHNTTKTLHHVINEVLAILNEDDDD